MPSRLSAPTRQPIVIWFGRVGDMILLSTLLDILHRRYGTACRLIGAGSWTAEIYRSHRDVARVHCLRRYTLSFIRPHVVADGLGVAAVGVRSDLRSARRPPRKLARIRRLLKAGGIDPARCLFITEDPTCHELHWVDRLISFGRLTPPALRESDYPWPSPEPLYAPRLEVSASERAECDAWIATQGWSGRPIVLVQPGIDGRCEAVSCAVSPLDDKAWPVERWATLLQKIHTHLPDAAILLCGAPKETLLLGWIQAAAKLPSVSTAEIPLGRLLALCQSAHSMVSVDTGPAHAAAALGLPLVVVFGAQSQAEWLPRSSSGSPVVGIGGPPTSTHLDQIPVTSVFEAWRELPAREHIRAPDHPPERKSRTARWPQLTPPATVATSPPPR